MDCCGHNGLANCLTLRNVSPSVGRCELICLWLQPGMWKWWMRSHSVYPVLWLQYRLMLVCATNVVPWTGNHHIPVTYKETDWKRLSYIGSTVWLIYNLYHCNLPYLLSIISTTMNHWIKWAFFPYIQWSTMILVLHLYMISISQWVCQYLILVLAPVCNLYQAASLITCII